MELKLIRSPRGFFSFELTITEAEDSLQRDAGIALYNVMEKKADQFIQAKAEETKARRQATAAAKPPSARAAGTKKNAGSVVGGTTTTLPHPDAKMEELPEL